MFWNVGSVGLLAFHEAAAQSAPTLAGWTTAREFCKLNPTAPVTLVCADAGDFYAKPSLSKALAQKRAPEQLVSTPAAKMARSLNLTLTQSCLPPRVG